MQLNKTKAHVAAVTLQVVLAAAAMMEVATVAETMVQAVINRVLAPQV